MTGQGQIFASGISLVLTAPGTSLLVPAANGALKYLLLVDSDGNPIVPVYEATTVDGVAMAGVRIALPSVAGLAALDARVTTAEGDIDSLENFTQALSNDIAELDTRLVAQEAIDEPFLIEWDPPVFPETIAQIVIDWNATEGSRHAKVETTAADSVNLAASTNAIEGFTYTITFSGAAADRTYDVNWVAGTEGTLYPASGDPEIVVYKFVYMSGKMRQVGKHLSQDA